jgi:hypothetical protein
MQAAEADLISLKYKNPPQEDLCNMPNQLIFRAIPAYPVKAF